MVRDLLKSAAYVTLDDDAARRSLEEDPSKINSSDFRHVDWFLTEGPGKSYRGVGFVVYLGEHLLSFGPGRVALPASCCGRFQRNREPLN